MRIFAAASGSKAESPNLTPDTKKGREMRPYPIQHKATIWPRRRLLNLGFIELDVLANDGVIFAESQLFRLIARVFLSDIEKAGVSGAEQFDFYSGWLRHDTFL